MGNLSVEDKKKLAEDLTTPAHALESLSKDNKTYIRSVVADNPNTPAHVLETLSKDEDQYVRGSVASNPNTPAQVLENLSKDEILDVRKIAIRTLEKLKHSSD